MPSLCSVISCRNSSVRTKIPSVRYFKAPKNDYFGSKWVQWTARENAPISKSRKRVILCCEHFKQSSILANGKLVPGTVPSIGKRISHALDEPTDQPINLSSLLESSESVLCCPAVKTVERKFKDKCSSSGLSDHRIPDTGHILSEEHSTASSLNISSKCENGDNLHGCMLSQKPSSDSKNSPSAVNHGIVATGQVSGVEHPTACPTDSTPKRKRYKADMQTFCPPKKEISSGSNKCAPDASSPMTPASKACKSTRRYKRYLVELSPGDFSTPRRAAKNLNMAKESNLMLRNKMKFERNKRYRLERRVKNLESLVQHLQKEKRMVDNEAALELQSVFPGAGGELYQRASKARRGSFCPELREFALTLHFHSTAAYNYVRKVFLKSLPHEKTIVKWYMSVEAEPGFTHCAVQSVKTMAADMKGKGKTLAIALSMDEMHIRLKKDTVGGKKYGFPDFGFGEVKDNSKPATKALVFMATAMNGSWKVPVGYFFLNSLNANQRSVLMKDCIHLLLETGAEVPSLTFDGDSINLSAASSLGASFNPHGDWRPYITVTRTVGKRPEPYQIEIILDACHMIKLVRNSFADPEVKLFYYNGQAIEWKYVERLLTFQETEGLWAANKARRRHVKFFNEKQKVKLAVQLLSRSVAVALNFLEFDIKVPEFQGAKPTADFILLMNDIFDVLNTCNLYGLGLKGAASPRNIVEIRNFVEHAKKYLNGLSARVFDSRSKKWKICKTVFDSRKKTGFVGLLTGLSAVIRIYERFVPTILSYVGMYKCSQDHVETFFSAVRARGGFRNNPTAFQFVSAYKRLLVHVQLSPNARGNCWPIDLTSILTVSSTRRLPDEHGEEETESEVVDDEFLYMDLPSLSVYVEDVVGYIGGFVSRSVAKKIDCSRCCDALFGDVFQSRLILLRDKGGLLTPSSDVVFVCKLVEKEVRHLKSLNVLLTTKSERVRFRIKHALLGTFVFACLDAHVLEHNFLDNHRDKLVNAIIDKFFSLRVRHEASRMTEDHLGDRIRTRNNKLVLFQNQ